MQKMELPCLLLSTGLWERKNTNIIMKSFVLLIPNHKLIIVNYGENPEAFEDFAEDMIDDLGHLSDRYEYMKVLGRPRQWRKAFTAFYDYDEIERMHLQDFWIKTDCIQGRKKEKERF